MTKPINPLADHLAGIVTARDIQRERPKEGPVPTKQVVGGIIKRIAVDRTARIVTSPANWMCKPLFENVDPQTISNEAAILRDALKSANETIQTLSGKLKAKSRECLDLKAENGELRTSLEIALQSCQQNVNAMGRIIEELT